MNSALGKSRTAYLLLKGGREGEEGRGRERRKGGRLFTEFRNSGGLKDFARQHKQFG